MKRFLSVFEAYRSPKKILYLVSLGILIMLAPFVLWSMSHSGVAEAGWFNGNWEFRVPIEITNPSADELHQFQVSFELDTQELIASNKMQAGCEDIRVVLASGDVLPYWIETGDFGCDESATRVWTKVPSIPSDGITIYAYYGNSTVIDGQDGDAVFEFFDDFSGESLDEEKWSVHNPSQGSVTVSDGLVTVSNTDGASTVPYGLQSTFLTASDPLVVQSRSRVSLGRHASVIGLGVLPHPFPHAVNGNDGVTVYYRQDAGSNTCSSRSNSTTSAGNGALGNFNFSQFSVTKLEFNPGQLARIYVNDDLHCNVTNTSAIPSLAMSVVVAQDGWSPVVTTEVDFIFVRKYLPVELSSESSDEQLRPPMTSVSLGPVNEFSPTQIDGLQLWLDAADQSTLFQDSAGNTPVMADGDPVGRWEDKSGGGNHATQTTEANRPTYKTNQIDGKPIVRFDGSNSYLVLPTDTFNDADEVEIIFIINSSGDGNVLMSDKNIGQSTEQFLILRRSGDQPDWRTSVDNSRGGLDFDTSWNDSTNRLVCARYDSVNGEMHVRVDGEDDGSNTNTDNGSLKLVDVTTNIGRDTRNSNYLSGDIAEILIFNTALSISERQQVEGYLAHKWGLVDSLPQQHPFKSTPAIVDGVTIRESLTNLPDPIAYWKFDEGRGDTAHDSVGSNDATLYSVKRTNQGKFGRGLLFDQGTNQRVLTSNPVVFSENATRFVTAWINPDSAAANNWRSALAVRGGNLSSLQFWGSGGRLDARICKATDLNGILSHPLQSNDFGKWHHVAFGYNQLTDTIYYYFNGELVDSKFLDGIGCDAYDGGTNMVIGSAQTGGTSFNSFVGKIDEVKIYDTALSPAQVKLDMNQGAQFVMGASGTNPDGTPSYSADRRYCVPGDSTHCSPPVGEWLFEENTGSTAYDTSGNGNHGTLQNMDESNWTLGANNRGAGLEFNGTNSFVDIPSHADLNMGTNNFTINAWVKLRNGAQIQTHSPNRHGVVAKTNTSGSNPSGYQLVIRTGAGFNGFGVRLGNGSSDSLITPNSNVSSVLLDYAWHHLSVVVDRSAGLGYSYLDGKLVGTSDISSFTGNVDSPLNLRIGQWANSDYFDGSIDQVRIYDYARTPAQIAWEYNQGAPIAHWKFDECSGNIAHDSSGNENHGTIHIGSGGSQTQVGDCNTPGTAWGDGSDGKVNTAIYLDGTDDYVALLPANEFNLPNRSVAFWFNASDFRSANIFDAGSGSPNRWYMGIMADGRIRTRFGSSGSFFFDKTYTLNEWYHFAVSYDGTVFRIYINGNLAGEHANTSLVGAIAPMIGSHRGVNSFFRGLVDEVKIFNYTITEMQVREMYSGGSVRFNN